jgi:hypothetical protein
MFWDSWGCEDWAAAAAVNRNRTARAAMAGVAKRLLMVLTPLLIEQESCHLFPAGDLDGVPDREAFRESIMTRSGYPITHIANENLAAAAMSGENSGPFLI